MNSESSEQMGAKAGKARRSAIAGAGEIDDDGVRDCPVLEHYDPIGQRNRLVDIVRDQEDAEAVPSPQVEQK